MTFFEKRDLWQAEAEKAIVKNKNIIDVWYDDSRLSIFPDGSVEIIYVNPNIPTAKFENVFMSLEDFFKTL